MDIWLVYLHLILDHVKCQGRIHSCCKYEDDTYYDCRQIGSNVWTFDLRIYI